MKVSSTGSLFACVRSLEHEFLEEVELVERPPTPETAVEEVEDVTEAQNELEPVPVTTAVEEEKKKILENG